MTDTVARGTSTPSTTDTARAGWVLTIALLGISFAGPLTRQGNALPEVARMVPLDRVLVETDSPYLVPKPLQVRRNEPLFVKRVAEKLAEIRALTLTEIAHVTSDNTIRLFGL